MLSKIDNVWPELDYDAFHIGDPDQLDHALLVLVLAWWVGDFVQVDFVDLDPDEEADHGRDQLNGYIAGHLLVVRFESCN
jgi:hypothetical protein